MNVGSRYAFFGILVALLFLRTSDASAGSPELRLQLDVADDSIPTHVCVISGGSDRASSSRDPNERSPRLSIPLKELRRSKQMTAPPRTANQRYSDDEFVLDLDAKEPEAKALGHLSWHNDAHVTACEKDEDASTEHAGRPCVPTFTLERFALQKRDDLFVHCAANAGVKRRQELDPRTPNRALFIALTAQQIDNVPVADVDIDGKHLVIRVAGLVGVDFTFNVLGGFFAPIGEVHVNSDAGRGVLALEPRCQWKDVTVAPGTVNGLVEYGVGKGDQDASAQVCVDGRRRGKLRVLLPYEPFGRKHLTISGPEDSSGDRDWQLSATWHSPRPPGGPDEALSLGVMKLAFTWARNTCLSSKQSACPSASLVASDAQCRLAREEHAACHYTCSAQESDPDAIIAFPTRVTLATLDGDGEENQQFPRWTLRLDQIGATLEGNGPASERVLRLDMSEWRSPARPRRERVKELRRFPCDLYSTSRRREKCRATLRREREGGLDGKALPPQGAAETSVAEAKAAAIPVSKGAAETHTAAEAEAKAKEERLALAKFQEDLRAVICRKEAGLRDDVFYIEFSTPYDKARKVPIHGILGCEMRGGSASNSNGTNEDLERATPFTAAHGNLAVKLPQVTCRDALSVKFVGEREYVQLPIHADQGALRLPHPMEAARLLYFEVGLYPAVQVTISPSSVGAQETGVPFSLVADGALVFKPRGEAARGMRLAIAATFAGGTRPYLGVDDAPNDTRLIRRLSRTLYGRVYLGADAMSSWLGKRRRDRAGIAASLGGGIQAGLGFPFTQNDVMRLGGVDWGLIALRGHLRIRFSKHIEGAFSPRLLLAEKVIAFHTDFHGQPSASPKRNGVAWLLPLGLVFVW